MKFAILTFINLIGKFIKWPVTIFQRHLKDKIKVAAIHPGWVKTTLTERNIEKGRLTAEQSADNMFKFIDSKFESGVFWDSENGVKLLW